MGVQWANYASTVLVGPLTASSTALTVVSAAGFPTIGGGDWFYLTLIDEPSYQSDTVPPGQREIVKVTSVSGNNLTVARGVDGTVPQIWAAGAVVELRVTAAALNDIPASISTLTYTAPISGATSRSLVSKLTDFVSVKDFGAAGNGTTDDAAAIQLAVNGCAGRGLYFPAGNYLINSSVNILSHLHILGEQGLTNVFIGSQNQNGFVVGDGTSGTRSLCYNTTIEAISFAPKSGVSASSSGECIFLNYVSYINVIKCSFDGRDAGGPKRLFHGVYAYQTTESLFRDCVFVGLLGNGIKTGSGSPSLLTVDCRIDFCEFISSVGPCIYFGDTTGGMTINSMITYSNTTWAIEIDSGGGGGNVNYFIHQPDLQIDPAAGGIYCKRGTNVQIMGGWIGSTGTNVTCLQVDSAAGSVQATGTMFFGNVILSGGACSLIGCDVAGDNSTFTTGVTINSGAIDATIVGGRIRQWITQGVAFVGNPPRCIIDGVSFRNNALNVTGDAFSSGQAPPYIRNCYDDFTTFNITAAATLPLRHGMDFVAVTGATAITAMTTTGFGSRVTIYSSGGITINNTASIALKGGSNASVTNGTTIDFVCDGVIWHETARSF